MFKRTACWMATCVVVGIVACGGCGQQPRRFAKPEPPDLRRFGELPGLAKSVDPQLVDEFARLQAEEATPAHLAASEPAVDVLGQMHLRDDIPVQRVVGLLEDIAKVYPQGRFEFSTASGQRARDLMRNESALIEKAQSQWQDGKQSIVVDHTQGLLADHYLFDLAMLSHRAWALQAHAALADGELDFVENAIQQLLALDHRLAKAPSLVSRTLGAQLRMEALRVLEAFVRDEGMTAETLVRFRSQLQEQLADWPSDANAWIGDRAQGLHTYEMIRHGMVLSVFTDDELLEMSNGAGASATAKAIAKDIDADEAYYLCTMREIIIACEQPYFQRRKVLKQVRSHLHQIRNAPDFPIVAGRYLLVDLDSGHRLQAKDRAACEGWVIALCAATGAPTPSFTLNPETGVAYTIEHEATRVVLQHSRAGEPDDPLIVPAFESDSQATVKAVNPTTNRAR